jgi:antitoxin component of RelBE/YafQ-DinJ toxin-antitoxin module
MKAAPTYHKAVRIPVELYEDAERIQDELGINFSEMVRILLLVATTGGIIPEALAYQLKQFGVEGHDIKKIRKTIGKGGPQQWKAWAKKHGF